MTREDLQRVIKNQDVINRVDFSMTMFKVFSQFQEALELKEARQDAVHVGTFENWFLNFEGFVNSFIKEAKESDIKEH